MQRVVRGDCELVFCHDDTNNNAASDGIQANVEIILHGPRKWKQRSQDKPSNSDNKDGGPHPTTRLDVDDSKGERTRNKSRDKAPSASVSVTKAGHSSGGTLFTPAEASRRQMKAASNDLDELRELERRYRGDGSKGMPDIDNDDDTCVDFMD